MVIKAILICMMVTVVWMQGVMPMLADLHHYRFKRCLAVLNEQKRLPRVVVNGVISEAETAISNAMRLDPGNSVIMFEAGSFAANYTGNIVTGLDLLNRAAINPNGDITEYSMYFIRALFHFQNRDNGSARRDLVKACWLWPNFKEAKAALKELDKATNAGKP
jgi:hypothetical protein